MPSRAQEKRLTIKMFARDYFQRVNYVDVYGRNVGFDYAFILEEIKKQFPTAKTSKTWLRRMAYEVKDTVRMPVRRYSRSALAEDYAKVLLLRRRGKRAYDGVSRAVKNKFPDQRVTFAKLHLLDLWLAHNGFTLPPRQ